MRGYDLHAGTATPGETATDAEAPAQWPPILDAATWARAREALAARRLGGARPRGGTTRTTGWVLRDVATCAGCGARMAAAWSGAREYYRCNARCGAPYVPRGPVEDAACALVLARLTELRHELAADEPSSPRPIADAAGTRAKLARRRARYLELAAGDLMTDDELRAALLRVDDELRGLAEAPRDARPRRERLAEVDVLARAWEAATGPERRWPLAGRGGWCLWLARGSRRGSIRGLASFEGSEQDGSDSVQGGHGVHVCSASAAHPSQPGTGSHACHTRPPCESRHSAAR